MALPKSHEEDAPTFAHHAVADLPRFEGESKRVRLIIGSLFGKTSPAAFPHDCFYAEAVLAPAPFCRSIPTTTSAPSLSHRPASISRDSRLTPASFSFSSQAIPFRSLLKRTRGYAARRRADGRATSHLVELRIEFEGSHCRSQERLASRPFRKRSRRRNRIYSVA